MEFLRVIPIVNIVSITCLPFITTLLSIYINKVLVMDNIPMLYIMITHMIYNYSMHILQSRYVFHLAHKLEQQLVLRLTIAKLKCGVIIPGVNQKEYTELLEHDYKLKEFYFIIPLLWVTIITFTIAIINLDSSYRLMFTVLCIILLCLLIYLTDISLYESTKEDNKKITTFKITEQVKVKISMGCVIDSEFELTKQEKQERQQEIQKYAICFLNFVIMSISLYTNRIDQLHTFEGILWMIGCLADNIKSLQYITYTNKFITLCKTFEHHVLQTGNINEHGNNTLHLENVTFGYFDDDLNKTPKYIPKLMNLTYTFNSDKLYYLEATNGVGKTTMLKAIQSNLHSGNIYFGNTNRSQLDFTNIQEDIFYVAQASEYTPKFTEDEIIHLKDKNVLLQEQLGINSLWGKHTVEMSGGQKKRMLIYIALLSNARKLLFDETLSELSSEETTDVKEGGGWLNRVINTLVECTYTMNKIMIIVGHGNKFPTHKNIIKLTLYHHDNKTFIKKVL